MTLTFRKLLMFLSLLILFPYLTLQLKHAQRKSRDSDNERKNIFDGLKSVEVYV